MDWDREQQSKVAAGERPMYRVLEAAKQEDLSRYFAGFLHLLLRCPQALAPEDRTLSSRAILSRLASRALCSMHQLLRVRRNSSAYSLFLSLETGSYPEVPPCLRDELSTSFRKWFPAYCRDAAASLAMLATTLDLDIAPVESRHALSRRLAHIRGTHVHAPTVEQVSAEWTIRRLAVQEREHAPSTYRRAEPQEKQPKNPPKQGKQPGARGGGGGAYNAFIHTVHRGKKLTTESIRRITEEYHALPAAEMQKYKRLGELGNLAWRSGHAAFGARTRDRAPTQELPALPSQPGGALPQHDRAEAEANLALSRIPLAARDFEDDLQEIRRRFRVDRQRLQSAKAARESCRQAHQDEVLTTTPDLIDDVALSETCGVACGGAQHLSAQLQWFPPCRAFTEAGVRIHVMFLAVLAYIYTHTHRIRASKPSSVRAPIYPRPPGTPSATQPSTCPKPKSKFEATLALAIS